MFCNVLTVFALMTAIGGATFLVNARTLWRLYRTQAIGLYVKGLVMLTVAGTWFSYICR